MKPFGREKNIKASGIWKKDYHLHKNGRKIRNWWEAMCNFVSRKTIKQNINKEIRKEL